MFLKVMIKKVHPLIQMLIILNIFTFAVIMENGIWLVKLWMTFCIEHS